MPNCRREASNSEFLEKNPEVLLMIVREWPKKGYGTWRKKYFMIDNYVLHKLLGRIKEIIGVENFDDTKLLIDTYDKWPDDITLKNVLILMACVIKDDDKFSLQLFIEQAFLEA